MKRGLAESQQDAQVALSHVAFYIWLYSRSHGYGHDNNIAGTAMKTCLVVASIAQIYVILYIWHQAVGVVLPVNLQFLRDD